MKLAIYTLQSVIFEGDVMRITLPTPDGEITLLSQHTPLVAIVSPGLVRYALPNGESGAISLAGGILEMRPESEAVILANGNAL